MKHLTRSIRWTLSLALCFVALAGFEGGGANAGPPAAQTGASVPTVAPSAPHAPAYRLIYSFSGAAHDGSTPEAGLTVLNGELYGTTYFGGGGNCAANPANYYGCGTIFKVSTAGVESLLWRFQGGVYDGGNPNAPLLNLNGSLFGTTYTYGATANGCCGTVFALYPSGFERVLYRFRGGPTDGSEPGILNTVGGLVALNGNLYGTTAAGGTSGSGTVFELNMLGVEKVIHNFSGAVDDIDAVAPSGGLIVVNGTLYGASVGGGPAVGVTGNCGGGIGCGTIFAMSPSGVERQLYAVPALGSPIQYLNGNLLDVGGTLFGTAGGAAYGNIYTISTSGVEKLLYAFGGSPDGNGPVGGLTEYNGVLYGTTSAGGVGCFPLAGCGTIFSITSSGTEQIVYRFQGGSDGFGPNGNLVVLNGILYGTTSGGGRYHYGTVFALKP